MSWGYPETGRGVRSFAGNVLLIAGAAGSAQVFAFCAVPLMTRIYRPEAFGHFAFFNAAMAMIYPLTSLRYEWAMLVTPDEDTAHELLALATGMIMLTLVVFTMAAVGFLPLVTAWRGMSAIELVLFPFALAVFSLNGVTVNWLTRERAFGELAVVRFFTPLAAVACQIGLGWVNATPSGLIVGSMCGYVLGFAVGGDRFRRALARILPRLRFTALRRAAAEYRSFAMLSAPSNVLNALGSQLPSLVFPWLYGTVITGQYSLARRVLVQPRDLICQSVNQVYWSDSARLFAEDPGRLWALFLRLTTALMLAMTPGIILTWYGGEIFSFLFGPAWAAAGRFAGVMIFANCIGMAAQGTTSLGLFRLNHWMSLWEVLQLVLIGSALVAAWRMALTPLGCVTALSFALAVAGATLIGLNGLAICRARCRANSKPERSGLPALPKEPPQ